MRQPITLVEPALESLIIRSVLARLSRGQLMGALMMLLAYISPFVTIGIIAQRWLARRGVTLPDVRA